VLERVKQSTLAFQGKLLEQGAGMSAHSEVQGPRQQLDAAIGGGGEEMFETIYKTAHEACRMLVIKGDYGDLQAVIRNVQNLSWRQLDKVAGTVTQAAKLRRELSKAFTTKILPIVQKTGGAALRDVLIPCSQVAERYGEPKKDNVLGYLMSRLAEPVHNISTVNGKVMVLAPEDDDLRGDDERDSVVSDWADEC